MCWSALNEEPAFVAGISTLGSWYVFPDGAL
jgi:hypothetical protein